MMPKTNNIPEVRFAGFTDAWEQRKLDTITDVRDGTHDSPQYVETGHPFITSKNVKDGFINYEDIQYVSDKDYEEINKRSKVDKNDILMGMIGTIGNIALVRETPDFAIKNVALIKDIGDVYYRYLYHCLQSNSAAHQLDENLDGGTQKFIALNKIRELVIPVPSEHEQHKIGDYMESLDNLITLHQRKYERLKNVKKSMLEKMFPKNGSNIPEIRFAGFTDAWEQRKLSDLIIEYKETVDSDCTLPVLTSSKTEGVVLQEEHFGRVQNHDITGYNILPRNYCTYRNRSDGVDFTFNINRCCDKGIISKFYPVFYGNNSDIFFISMVLNYCDEVVHEIAYTCTGTGQKVLSFLDLQKMNIRVPSYDEQKKISQYFEQLDNLITLHQRKLEKLQNIKKSMLEKMFV